MKSASTLMIKRPGAMTPRGRKDIAIWLRKQAANLLKYGERYNDTSDFRARYEYVEDK